MPITDESIGPQIAKTSKRYSRRDYAHATEYLNGFGLTLHDLTASQQECVLRDFKQRRWNWRGFVILLILFPPMGISGTWMAMQISRDDLFDVPDTYMETQPDGSRVVKTVEPEYLETLDLYIQTRVLLTLFVYQAMLIYTIAFAVAVGSLFTWSRKQRVLDAFLQPLADARTRSSIRAER